MLGSDWDFENMQYHLSDNVVEHVRLHLRLVRHPGEGDKPWWIKFSSGKFSVKSAWEERRKKTFVMSHFRRSG